MVCQALDISIFNFEVISFNFYKILILPFMTKQNPMMPNRRPKGKGEKAHAQSLQGHHAFPDFDLV